MAFPENNRRRWLEELRLLRAAHPAIERVAEEPHPLVEGTIDSDRGTRRYRLVWPPDFPLRPPTVWELNADRSIVGPGPDGFVFTDGSFCLFAHDLEQGWRPELTAVEALERLRLFLDADDRSEFPRVDDTPVETSAVRVSIHPNLAAALRKGGSWGGLVGFARADGRMILVTQTDGTDSPRGSQIILGREVEEPPRTWLTAMRLDRAWEGYWCRAWEEAGTVPPSRAELNAWLRSNLHSEEARQHVMSAKLLLLVQDDAFWCLFLNPGEPMKAALDEMKIPLLVTRAAEENIPQRIFARVLNRLDNRDELRAGRVALVGVGSLGSSIALALAKAGVSRFLLLDPEHLAPENVARHVGGLEGIGRPKVEVVADAVHRVNPDAEVVPVRAALSLDPSGWGPETTGRLLEVARDPKGVVICTAATADVEQVVNALCVREGCPAVFGAVLGQAEHGRIFRVVPGKTSCHQCICLAQAADPTRFPRFQEQDVGAPAYPQPGIPGLGMDIDQVALIAARLALQTLAERVEGGIGYPAAHGDHFLWSNHGGWAVDGPLQARVEKIPRQSECSVCGDRLRRELSADEATELARLLVVEEPERKR